MFYPGYHQESWKSSFNLRIHLTVISFLKTEIIIISSFTVGIYFSDKKNRMQFMIIIYLQILNA